MTNTKDPIAKLVDEINGSCGPHMIAGINGNLPPGWRAGQIQAMPTFRDPTITVLVEAYNDGATLHHGLGAKMEISPPYDHLKLAGELAVQLAEKIRRRERDQVAGQLAEVLGPVVKFTLAAGAVMPSRGSAGSSGYDLYAPAEVRIAARQVVVVHSGVSLELPDGFEGQVRGRSSLSKRGLWVNTGTVDSDYRGVIGATVANITTEDATILRGDRYAQLVIARVEHPAWLQVDELTPTPRGTGGFGSTGR